LSNGKVRDVTLRLTLAASISLLIAISVIAVLFVGLGSARRNTTELLQQQASMMIDHSLEGIDGHLQPMVQMAAELAEMMEEGRLDPFALAPFQRAMLGALTAARQAEGVLYLTSDLRLIGARRRESRLQQVDEDLSADSAARDVLEIASGRSESVWGPPIWRAEANATFLNLLQPVRRGGRFLGVLVVAVTISAFSDFVTEMSSSLGDNGFVLYGRDHVLAHRQLVGNFPGLSEAEPLPSLRRLGDPILSAIWDETARVPAEIPLPEGLQGFIVNIFNDSYLFIFKEVTGYGRTPWRVGTYFRTEDIGQQLSRLRVAGLVGLAAMAIAIVAGVIVARRIASPIRRLADVAQRIGRLEFASIETLPATRFRELNEQVSAFNTMVRALKWFEIYVPRTLVQHLVAQEDKAGGMQSESRQATVLFTDIVGFTTFAEGRSAEAVAAFLNHHFAMLGGAVEAEGGTVDKFIGDALMAFWGAPEHQPDHADRAVRAARRIAAAIAADNDQRQGRGEPTVRIRVGIHSGAVVVGNIGAPQRMNYTIVGDTVNIAQRLEQLGKEVAVDDAGTVVLISDATRNALTEQADAEAVGAFHVKGRDAKVDVFRLRVN
jgi:class 3 adenylate cyclase